MKRPTRMVAGTSDVSPWLGDSKQLSSIRAYDQVKSRDDEAIPFEQAVEEIERN